ncbi:MAG: hypothetical protein WKF48_05875 [Solirubrobacteraceae bacterium]
MTVAQLTLDVQLHPSLREAKDPFITGSLKIGGELHCPQDLQAGDRITVTVADADGTVIAQGEAIATYPGFREIKDHGCVIGTERINKAAFG